LPKHQYLSDAKTAGATTLLFQSALPICVLGGGRSRAAAGAGGADRGGGDAQAIKLILKGGTNVPFSPQVEWLQNVLGPNLGVLIGLDAKIDLSKRGVFPKGGGQIEATISTRSSVPGFSILERGQVKSIGGISWACGDGSEGDGDAMAKAAAQVLQASKALGGVDIKVEKCLEPKVSSSKCVAQNFRAPALLTRWRPGCRKVLWHGAVG
jgi:RNA 3'-terminal phosphate cyclase (ATP)